MARGRISVSDLSRETGVDTETVRFFLRDADIDFDVTSGVIPRSQIREARRALGLPSARDLRSVSVLARQAGLSEREALERLEQARVLDGKRVRRGGVSKAQRVLGITLRRDSDFATGPAQGVERPHIQEPLVRDAGSRKTEVAWSIVGPPLASGTLAYMSLEDVLEVHFTLVRDFRGTPDPVDPPGVRDEALLASAVYRQHTGIGEEVKYPSVPLVGAALFHALVHDHPFHNGNKRTALVSLMRLLDRNGLVLESDQSSLYDFVLTVAKHKILDQANPALGTSYTDAETILIARWIQRHSRAIDKVERRIKFRQLRNILGQYGCTLDVIKGNKCNISREVTRRHRWGRSRTETLTTQVKYGGEGREVQLHTIRMIRSALELDEQHGYDSTIFYQAERPLDDFILTYRRTLERLAKV